MTFVSSGDSSRPWAASITPPKVMVALGLVGVMIVVIVVALLGGNGAPPLVSIGDGSADAGPDAVVLVTSGASEDAEVLAKEIGDLSGVAWTGIDVTTGNQPLVLAGFTEAAGDTPYRAIDSIAKRFGADASTEAGDSGSSDEAGSNEAGAEEAKAIAGGRIAIDDQISSKIGGAITIGVVLGALVLGAGVFLFYGWPRGVVAGAALFAAVALARVVASRAVAFFDGSTAVTGIPAALVAAVVSTWLVLRMLRWFNNAKGDDQAERIRYAVMSVAYEIGLLIAGLTVLSLLGAPFEPARAIGFVVLASTVASAMVTLAIVPAVLSVFDEAGPPFDLPTSDPETGESGTPFVQLLPFGEVPSDESLISTSGRRLKLIFVGGCGLVLALLAFATIKSTDNSTLLDGRSLSASSAIDTELADSGGDPTSAIVAVFPTGADQQAKQEWLATVSDLDAVGRVDSADGRFVSGKLVTEDPTVIGIPDVAIGVDEAPVYALVVPAVSPRSPAGQQLVADVAAIDVGMEVEMAGQPVDAVRAAERDRSTVWASVILLALVGGAAAMILTGDVMLAGAVFGLRLLEAAAVAGIVHLLVGEVAGGELQVVMFVALTASSLFELGFLNQITEGREQTDTTELLDATTISEGIAAMAALGVALMVSFGLLFSGLSVISRLGIVAAVAFVLHSVLGLWLLGPAVLGNRSANHLAERPVKAVMAALDGGAVAESVRAHWVAVTGQLLLDEFGFQADPAEADLDVVFVAGSALHREAAQQHGSLVKAGLRVVGRAPQLRSLRVVEQGPPTGLAITVDNPVRQLLDATDNIVGVRKAERRSVLLWMAEGDDGGYRIADSVELGVEALEAPEETLESVAPPAVALGVE